MDEIRLKSEYSYKAGKIIGSLVLQTNSQKLYLELWFLVFSQSGLLSFDFYHVPKLAPQKYFQSQRR